MAARLLTYIRPHPAPLVLGLGASSLLFAHSVLRNPPQSMLLRCDSPFRRYESEAKTPLTKGGRPNPSALKEISKGSILGLLGGVAIGVFSKPLTFLIGLLLLGAQALESRGIRVIPYNRIQRLFSGTDVKSALQDNVAFKLSFALTFLLAGFAEFGPDQ